MNSFINLRLVKLDARMLRWLFAIGVMAASGIAGWVLSPTWGIRALVLLLGAGFSLLVLRYPPLGLLALVVATLVVNVEIGTGTQVGVNIAIILVPLLTGLWVLSLVLSGEVRLTTSRLIPPLIGLAIVAFLAFIVGQLDYFPFAPHAPITSQLGGLAMYWWSIAAFLLAAHQIPDMRWLARITWVFLILGGLYILGRTVGGAIGQFLPTYAKGATGSVFWIWLAVLAFSQGVFNRELKPVWRGLLLVLVGLTFYVGYFQGRSWTSGWLPGLIGVLVVLWMGHPKLGFGLALAAGVFVLLQQDVFIEQSLVSPNEYSILSRAEAWRIMLEIIRTNPLLGLGPSNYYFYTPLFPIWGWRVSFNSHNQFIDLLAQTGVLGLGLYIWFFAEVAALGLRLRHKVRGDFARAYLYGAIGGAAGMFVCGYMGDWVIPFVYNIGFPGFRAAVLGWLFLGGLIIIEKEYIHT